VTEDSSSEVTSSTVFDFNGDGASEVVYNDEEQFFVLEGRTGRVLFRNWNPSQTRTEQAIVADVDGNGQADIVFGANQCADFAGDKIPAADARDRARPWARNLVRRRFDLVRRSLDLERARLPHRQPHQRRARPRAAKPRTGARTTRFGSTARGTACRSRRTSRRPRSRACATR
jgi:hypothetical protein